MDDKRKILSPIREKYPMIIGSEIDRSEPDQVKEIEDLASQINNLPYVNFAEDREKEISRLLSYYTEFTNLFGVDLIAVARTRMQSSSTIMKSSPLFMQSMIANTQKNEEKDIFFESRLEAGGFQLNATSENIIDGFSYRFSVLKRKLKDKYGDYEVDYPAVSLDRRPLAKLLAWHKSDQGDVDFSDNQVLKNMQDLFFLRVHDWFHASVLYDTSSTTNIFKKWSDNSFFVKHFFDNPFMINYELLADKTHFLVWQEIFKKNPELRKEIIKKASDLILGIAKYQTWSKENGLDIEESESVGNYLSYVGLRGLFNVIRFDDKDLAEAVGTSPKFLKVQQSLSPYKDYLSRIYEGIEDIPFRKGSDEKLSMERIFQEYVDALLEESRLLKAKAVTTEMLRQDLLRGGMKEVFQKLPSQVWEKMKSAKVDLSDFDPAVFKTLEDALETTKKHFGDIVWKEYLERIDIDENGYFYLRVNKNEVDLSSSAWVVANHSKKALLIQLPWEYGKAVDISVRRVENLLSEQVGASTPVNPGEVILINIADEELSERVVKESYKDGKFNFDIFWEVLERERVRGHQAFGDAYGYKVEKLLKVFDIPEANRTVVDGKFYLDSGVYSTFRLARKVIQSIGPISMNGSSEKERRRILYGSIVRNEMDNSEGVDVFPVDGRSFDRYYEGIYRLDLANFRFDENTVKIEKINLALEDFLRSLSYINTIRIYGRRGKPEMISVDSVLESFK